jgi:hypothetical protein
MSNGGAESVQIQINDGSVVHVLYKVDNANTEDLNNSFDFNIFLEAGDSLEGVSSATDVILNVLTRQIADLSGNLINP